MPAKPSQAARALLAYVSKLRRRALLQYGGLGALAAGALFAIGLAMAAALSGPVVSPRWAVAAWLACGIPAFVAFSYAGLRYARHRGRRATGLLNRHAPDLARSLRSALELGQDTEHGHSQALVEAHVISVHRRVRTLPVGTALPWRDLRKPWTALALLALLGGATLIGNEPHLAGGVIALLHPARRQPDGMLSAPIVEALSARLIFPSYLRRDPEPVPNPDAITAPVGTTIELSLKARLPAQEVMLVVGPQRMRLARRNGAFYGRVVARTDAALEVQLRSDGQWYRDATERHIRSLADHVPVVELTEPVDGAWIHADQPLPIGFRARDNEGLSSIDLALRLPDGQEVRRTLWSGVDAPEIPAELEDQLALLPTGLGVQPGDRFELWLEASDGDVVTGPNVGRSEPITLEAMSHARFLSQHLPALKEVLDLSITSLADRLETPIPTSQAEASKRYRTLLASEDNWLGALDELVSGLALQETDTLGLDNEQLLAMAKRYRRKRARERGLHRPTVGPHGTRARVDRLLVGEQERDIVLLADLLAQAHLDEANALAEELKSLKGRIQELLQRLSDSDDAEARRELLAEIARAERRLKELMRSMARLATHIPSEFVNQNALESSPSNASMSDLRASVQEGDLDAAARHLEELEQQLDALASGLESGGLRFREARFGKRDKAMMRAREQLAMLSEEQNRLAQESTEQTRRVMSRAGGGKQSDKSVQGLRNMADEARERLSRVQQQGLALGEQRMRERAQARLRDTRDALRTGDLSEAQRMAAASQRALEQLARNLESDARMFPGHDGSGTAKAQAARRANQAVEDLQQAIAQQTPRMADHLTGEDRRQMRRLAENQRSARDAAEKLRNSLASGPEGMPISPDGADAVRRAQDAMRRAENQLGRDDPQGAALTQEEAADELRQLSEKLARRQSGAEKGGGRRSGSAHGEINGRVRIPDAKDFEAPIARRRRLLDAMREGAPPGYEAAVGEYYRELLR